MFTKEERVRILQAWPPAAPEPSINDKGSLLYRCGNLDTAVISLKMKMMRLPTLYQVSFSSLGTAPTTSLLVLGNGI
jgi:hypothetical protein